MDFDQTTLRLDFAFFFLDCLLAHNWVFCAVFNLIFFLGFDCILPVGL